MSEAVRLLEAALFVAGRSMTEEELAAVLPPGHDLKAELAALEAGLSDRGVGLVRTAVGWALRTRPEASDLATAVVGESRRLTRAAAETLAVCACFGAVTRSEIERVRGVQISPGVVDQLLQAGFIRPGQRRDTPGRPLTWKVTDTFLEHFDLMSVDDLVSLRRMREAGLDVLPPLRQNPLLAAVDGAPEEEAEEAEGGGAGGEDA